MDVLRQQYMKIRLAAANLVSPEQVQAGKRVSLTPPPPVSKSSSDEGSPSSSGGSQSKSSSLGSPSPSDAIISIASPVSAPLGMDDLYASCLEGTRTALLEDMSKFVVGIGIQRMHILKGKFGQGKSTIARTLSIMAADLDHLGAEVFLTRHNATPINVYRSIAAQLARHIGLPRETRERLGTLDWDDGVSASDHPTQPLLSLTTILTQCPFYPPSRPVVIVVDALDECEEHGLSFLRGFHKLVNEVPFLRMFITTRPRSYLDTFVLETVSRTAFLIELEDVEDSRKDIEIYLKWHLISHTGLDWKAEEGDVRALADMAAGVFFVAASAVRFILGFSEPDPPAHTHVAASAIRFLLDKTGFFASTPSTRMRTLLYPSVPPRRTSFRDDLDAAYMSVLERAAPPDEMMDNFKLILGCVMVAFKPRVIVPALLHLYLPAYISVDLIHSTLYRLQDLIVADRKGRLMPYHLSFRDFMRSPERAGKMAIDRYYLDSVISARHKEVSSQVPKDIRWFYLVADSIPTGNSNEALDTPFYSPPQIFP